MKEFFKIVVRPVPAREEFIKRAVSQPAGLESTFDVFPHKKTDLPKINLPLDMPVYRVANGRTSIEQLDYLRREKKPPEFFSQGEETEQAQKVQHEILAKLAKKGSDSITPISKVLETELQKEPLWITPKGVVVNGNRRLAGMRELYQEDAKKYAKFQTVECSVLPPLTPEQIEELEIRLQVAPETKLPYGWIHDALLISRQISNGKSEEYVASLMNRRPADVRTALAALQEANIYLQDWKKTPRDFAQVEAVGKQFFNDLPKRLKNKSGVLLEVSRRIGWMLFDNVEELGTRLYSYNALIGEKADEVVKRLAANSDVLPDDEGEGEDTSGQPETDALEVDFDEPGVAVDPKQKVLEALNDEGRREEVAAAVITICTSIHEAGRTAAQGQSTLRLLSDIQGRLQEIDLTKAAKDTHAGIAKQLQEIVRLALDLEKRNTAYLGSTSKPDTKLDLN